MRVVDLAIVGGGPAGMSAASDAAAGGASVAVIDMYPELGGHYFKQPPAAFPSVIHLPDTRQAELLRLVSQLDTEKIEVLRNTVVWGVFHGKGPSFALRRGSPKGQSATPDGQTGGTFTLYLYTPDGPSTVEARTLLVAAGAYDRPMLFPGWTLPGVMTPGATQMLLKGQGILPGQRVIVAGGGPLIVAAAAGLVESGAEVVAVLDVAAPWDGWSTILPGLWGQWARLREVWDYVGSLARSRVPLRFRHTIFQAHGDTMLEAATFGRVNGQGYPQLETAQTVEVDTVCVGLGFLPNTALTHHLGCDHYYDGQLDAFFPRYAEMMETSTPSVFVAGDITDLGGKDLSKLQGQLAAIGILERLGYLSPTAVDRHRSALVPQIQRERRFTRLLRQRWNARPGLSQLISDDTIVCRCENVTASQLRDAVVDGARTIGGAKLRTRAGMGPCQGRYCSLAVNRFIAQATGQSRTAVGDVSVRPPLIPIPAGQLVPTSLDPSTAAPEMG